MLPFVNLALAGVLAAICARTDIKSMSIYNRHTYPAAAAGVAYSIATDQYDHLYGALIVLAMYLLLFMLGKGKMGGGDLKLAVALSLYLGHDPVIYGSIMAGLMLIIWGFISTWRRAGFISGVLVAAGKLPGGAVPYGAVLGFTSVLTGFYCYVIS